MMFMFLSASQIEVNRRSGAKVAHITFMKWPANGCLWIHVHSLEFGLRHGKMLSTNLVIYASQQHPLMQSSVVEFQRLIGPGK